MLDVMIQIITIILVVIGVFFYMVGTIGLLRFPDFYCRTHATTKCDTLGAGSILLGLAIYEHFSFNAFKILALMILILITSPTSGHLLARAAYKAGLLPWRKSEPHPFLKKEE